MRPSDFLPADTPALNLAIVEAVHDDIGETEDGPPYNNRGRYPDLVNAEFGSPLGSYWCANSRGHAMKKAGAKIPARDVGSCQAWLDMHKADGTFTDTPVPGASVLYGDKATGHADHIGTVEQIVDGRVLSIEGNTTLAGYDRNGWIVQQHEVNYVKLFGYGSPLLAEDSNG